MRFRVTLLISATLALLACGTGSSPTPGSILVIRDELTVRGVVIASAVSGESACPAQALHDNALHLRVTTASDPVPRDLYLYLFRVREFDATATQMDDCLAEYEATQGSGPYHRVEVAPYRALGSAWSGGLARSIREALEAAAG